MEVLQLQIAGLIRNVKYYCHDFWEIYGDHRVSCLYLLNSGPWHVLGLTAFYLYFVKILGPAWMKNRPPFDLRRVMLWHNCFLVFLNGGGFLVAMWGTDFGRTTLECRAFNPVSGGLQDTTLFYLGYTYYISKFIDFLDTIYFVLRKKYSHITGLHVFHHTMMPFWCYIFFKFSTYTNNGFIPVINAAVHTVMYTYYALAALEVDKKYLWWKKHITQLQLFQFVLATGHSLYFLLDSSCTCSKLLISFQALHGALFFYLFYSFYIKAYGSKSAKVSKKMDDDISCSKTNGTTVTRTLLSTKGVNGNAFKTLNGGETKKVN